MRWGRVLQTEAVAPVFLRRWPTVCAKEGD
jgi:hypothetical protein